MIITRVYIIITRVYIIITIFIYVKCKVERSAVEISD